MIFIKRLTGLDEINIFIRKKIAYLLNEKLLLEGNIPVICYFLADIITPRFVYLTVCLWHEVELAGDS